MNFARSYKNTPSTFALLVDNISKMSTSEQKLLWMQLNKKRISALAKEIDASVTSHTLSSKEIDELIAEAKQYARKKKS